MYVVLELLVLQLIDTIFWNYLTVVAEMNMTNYYCIIDTKIFRQKHLVSITMQHKSSSTALCVCSPVLSFRWKNLSAHRSAGYLKYNTNFLHFNRTSH